MFFRKKHPGFTIIELTVTVGLLVILLTLSSISYRRATKRTEIILAAHQIASTLRTAESNSASAKEIEGNADYNIWGVYFDKTSGNDNKVIMFVDKNKDGMYSEDEKNKVIDLPKQVRVFNLFYDGRADSRDKVSITFVPPDPKVRMCLHDSGNCNNAWSASPDVNPKFNSEPWNNFYLVLKDDLNDSIKDVNVNFFGMIDVR